MPEIDNLNLTNLSSAELIDFIYRLADENQILRTRIVELEDKLHEKGTGDGKKEPPSWVKPNIKHKKHHKRKTRAVNFARRKEKPTATVFHSFNACPDCGGNLGAPSVCYIRQIIDIPIVQTSITDHVVFKRYCANCKTRFYPRPDFSSLVFGNCRLGINLMAAVNSLREDSHLTLTQIQNILTTFYQVKVSSGEIIDILDKAALLGKRQYETIKNNLLSSNVIHADETGGREKGRNGYFWNFSNEKNQFVVYRHSRGSKIVKEVLGEGGENFDGILTTDFYAAYNEHNGFHQRCWVHLLRDIHNLTENYPKDKIVKRWAKDVRIIYDKAVSYTGPPQDLPNTIQEKQRVKQEQEFKKELIKICEPHLKTDSPVSTLSGRVIKFISELFTFVRFPNISSNNNKAERDIRHLVVSRKISGGTRSSKGSETKSILTSLFGTWRLQGLNSFEQTRLLFLNASCQEK